MPATSRTASRTRFQFRPRLEAMEDRNLLSTYTVDHLGDDLLGQGLYGSLRYCVTNATNGDTIAFAVVGTINLTGPLPDLTHSINIQGPGADLMNVRRHTGGNYRILTVGTGVTTSISGLTLSNGNSIGSDGGAVLNEGTLTISNSAVVRNASDGFAGGIANHGTMTVDHSNLSGNVAGPGGGGGAIFNINGILTINYSTISGNTAAGGGGIYNNGTLNLNGSTISGNMGVNAGGSGGGGIFNNGPLTVSNSTISGNMAIGGGGGGGAIYINTGTITLESSTITRNSTTTRGGGVAGGAITARNTIIAEDMAPTGPDISGDIASLGHNLIGNSRDASGFDSTDLLNIDPLLGPLQNNGGPTPTMALLAGSPAINAGDPSQLGTGDQRGVIRTSGVNIGAYQASATAFSVTAPSSVQAGAPFDVSATAVDPFGQSAFGYLGTIHFTSADPYGASLPSDYTFQSSDQGSVTFAAGAALFTAGIWDVTATDANGVTGTASVMVIPAAADHLLFLQQPTDTSAGQTISAVTVAIVDAYGNIETGDNADTITLAIGNNPSGGTLSGTVTMTVTAGIATFSDLSIDRTGSGYTLLALADGLTRAESDPFNITM